MSDEPIVPSPDDPLVPIGEVAKMFGVQTYTVRDWCNEGKIKGVKIQNRWKIQKSEIVRFANEQYN